MLDIAEPVAGAHTLVLCHGGTQGLDLLCGLIGRGCAAAVEMPADAGVPVEPAEIVMIPAIRDVASASTAILAARRCLLPCGRIVLQTKDDHLTRDIARLLRASGFSSIRTHGDVRGDLRGALISADLPMFGLHARLAGNA